ncbi:hypothetical protein EUGRSUZ_J02441 [Eucalyptus grandis]|uniref:KEN domain-containing protein n=2 Tax=Eucalyptus grandis TaxID=71139 RepID=A0A059AH37_EUCGR|nr:hypothetical protein EUGRSUZ_J02441 [Eucalyptus grandis]
MSSNPQDPQSLLSFVDSTRWRGRRSLNDQSRARADLDDGLESVIKQRLRQRGHVYEDNVDQIFAEFDLKDALMNDPSLTAQLNQKKNDVRMNLRCLLTNPKFSSEELKDYYPPICWNSEKSLDFLCFLSDRLSVRHQRSPQYNVQEERRTSVQKKLKSKKQQIFNGKWIDYIDHNLRQGSVYNDESVEDLLRFVRNKWRHRLELPVRI